jgi:hypothetical protein
VARSLCLLVLQQQAVALICAQVLVALLLVAL